MQLAFPGVAAAAPFVKEDKLRALAVMSNKRSVALPNVQTTAELGYPNLVSETWFGLLTPKGTPPEITQRINTVLNTALTTPAFKEKIEQMGYTPLGGSSGRFVAAIKDDIVKWGEVFRSKSRLTALCGEAARSQRRCLQLIFQGMSDRKALCGTVRDGAHHTGLPSPRFPAGSARCTRVPNNK
ncbi:MAG: hypothetical protein EOP20_08985 [Hyphomicrobiales bacterium]|nr:MAG: hypothetical protein EOP20_08985 [Hyphomicrobiales bacterium]